MTLKEYPIDPQQLRNACVAVIDALEPYPVPVKLAAIHNLMQAFPGEYQLLEVEEKKDGNN
jgi:hypothetical protein